MLPFDVIYSIKCNHCKRVYISETRKQHICRITYHKRNAKNFKNNSVLTEHSIEYYDHNFDSDGADSR